MDREHPRARGDRADPVLLRMFAGYAGSPLWSIGGPVPLGTLQISAGLRSGVLEWEAESYGGDGSLKDARAPGAGHLGRQLAAELGWGFQIEVIGTPEHTFIGEGAATSPEAAGRLRTEAAEGRALLESSRNGEFHAVAPLSGMTFRGGRQGR